MLRSIRWRIAIPYVILILATMVGVGIYTTNFLRKAYINDLMSELLSDAILTRENLKTDFQTIDPVAGLDDQAKKWADLLNSRVTLIGDDGTVLGESLANRQEMDNHSTREEIIQARDNGQGSALRFSNTEKYDMLYVAVPVVQNGERLGFVRISKPVREIDQKVWDLQRAFLLVALLASFIAILLAVYIANRTTRPIRDLTTAVDQLSSGNLKVYITPRTNDEVGQLTNSFNLMSSQLQSQVEALETEHSKLAAVLSEMSDGVIIVDKQGKIQLINPAAENMFAVSHEIVLERSMVEALRQHEVVEMWRRAEEKQTTQVETIELASRRVFLQGVATPFGEKYPGSTLLLFQDMTRLRQLETVRQDFISNLSHELRTPLASLKALTETLQESALEDPVAARRFLERIEAEVDSLGLMVSELLELSRIESGRVHLRMSPTKPIDLITRAVERLSLQANRANLDIEIDCSPELGTVLVDVNRMEQVLVNLLHNAIKFTHSGGLIEVSAKDYEGKILFSVKDNGIGIPKEEITRIFERFYKTDRARSGGGTGLGLAIAKHLVEAHNGKIWADSVEKQGTTFYFTLPISEDTD